MREKAARREQESGGVRFGNNAIPKSTQAIQGIIQDQIFFNMVVGRGKQFLDAEKHSFFGFGDAMRYGFAGDTDHRRAARCIEMRESGIASASGHGEGAASSAADLVHLDAGRG